MEKISLKMDLHLIYEDWQMLLKENSLCSDEQFLSCMSEHIKKLHDHTLQDKTNSEEITQLIRYLLDTTLGAPFVSEQSFYQASLNYSSQEPKTSDLHKILSQMIKFSTKIDNQFLKMFHSLESCVN